MAIIISGENNNDKILASDGVLDSISGINAAGIVTATSFTGDITGNVTGNVVGNLTGNVNHTSNLLLQISGTEKFRVGTSGQLGIGGANYGTSGQVLTSGGSGSAATWSTITGTTINNNADNRVITGSGSANTLEGEANLTFDGSTLGVNGNLSIADKIIHTGDTNTAIRFPAVDTVTVETNNTERFRIGSNGYVGIGTDNPSEKLDIISGTNSQNLRIWSKGSGNNSTLFLRTGDSGGAFIKFGDNSDNDIGQIHYSNTTDAMRFVVNTQERLRITSDGRMGLGTNSPSRILHIKSAGANATQIALIDNDSTNEVFRVGQQSDGDGFLQVLTDGATVGVQFDASGTSYINSGNFGVGTVSPTRTFHVKGVSSGNSTNRMMIIESTGTSGSFLAFQDANTTDDSKVRIGSIGGNNIGIRGDSHSFQDGGGNNKIVINSSGHVVPGTDSQYDLGLTGTRFRNVYADTLYGDGSNLTNLPGSTPPNNFLINGAMMVNVRGTNHQTLGSFNPVTSSIYTLDRWKVLNTGSFDTDSAKVVQDNVAPTSEGFRKSIMMNIGNTETPSSTQVCGLQQLVEAQNLQSLAYGTSSAKTMTLTFWVYSNKPGTYCVQLLQDDASKYVLYEYTISAQNTWEKKTITIAGNTSDAINNDTGVGLYVNWILCAGSSRQASATSSWTSSGNYLATSNQVNLWDHADNYFKMTGCQLQIGSATDFIHEDYGTTLRKCQRYFYMACGPDGGGYETIGTGMIYYSGTGYANCFFPVTMRTQPSLVALSGSSGAYMYQTLLSNTAAYTHQISLDSNKTSLNSASVSCACPSSRAGEAFRLGAHFSHDANGGQSFVNFDAEL